MANGTRASHGCASLSELSAAPYLHQLQSSHLLYFITPTLYWKQVCEPFFLPIPYRPPQTICVSVQKFRHIDRLLITVSPHLIKNLIKNLINNTQILDKKHKITEMERDVYSPLALMQITFSVTALLSHDPCISSFNVNISAVNMHEELVHWTDAELLLPLKYKNQFCNTPYKMLACGLSRKWCQLIPTFITIHNVPSKSRGCVWSSPEPVPDSL